MLSWLPPLAIRPDTPAMIFRLILYCMIEAADRATASLLSRLR